MRTRRKFGERMAYFQGQLLLAEDFIDEQRYHIHANERHNLALHGWGIIRGLAVESDGAQAVRVHAGAAIDRRGRDIDLDLQESLNLSECEPRQTLTISLSHEVEVVEGEPRLHCFAVLAAATMVARHGVVLARVTLDDHGRIAPAGIDMSCADRLRSSLAPGSVTVEALAPALHTGWLRMPFRAAPMARGPQGEDDVPPAFLVGATEARSHETIDGKKNTRGAGGTMGIPLPPGASRIHRFRIAGTLNAGNITVRVWAGGWDGKAHVRRKLLEKQITGAPYDVTWDLPTDTLLDDAASTLAVWVMGTSTTSVSLIAIELSL